MFRPVNSRTSRTSHLIENLPRGGYSRPAGNEHKKLLLTLLVLLVSLQILLVTWLVLLVTLQVLLASVLVLLVTLQVLLATLMVLLAALQVL